MLVLGIQQSDSDIYIQISVWAQQLRHIGLVVLWYVESSWTRDQTFVLCICIICSDAQSCATLCDPMDCSPPGSSIHGIFQARTLEQVAISSSRGSSHPKDWTRVSCISCIIRWILYCCTAIFHLARAIILKVETNILPEEQEFHINFLSQNESINCSVQPVLF